jgi:hypothetical protein
MKKFKDWVVFKGRKAKLGPVHTMDITIDHIRAVFFPKDFYEKYQYLGSVPWKSEGDIFKMMEPLVIFMDYKAKPWYCPRWFLRLLHLFGSDNSLVRMRNLYLHNLLRRLTKGIFMWDWKTKWSDYDLRISISGDKQMQEMADMIEDYIYTKGFTEKMLKEINDSNLKDQLPPYPTYCEIVDLYNKIEE